jgi:hypothetical protein
MINIRIDRTYKIFEQWSEMPLSVAIEIFKIPVPENLKAYFDARLRNETPEISDFDAVRVFPDYYGKVLCKMGLPPSIVRRIHSTDRTMLFNRYCLEFVLGLHYSPNFERLKAKSFVWNKEELFFPVSKKVLSKEVPFSEVSAFEFTESADLQLHSKKLAGGRYEVAANIVAILCRPKDEPYDENVCLARAETMKSLPMDIVWEVFFCLNELLFTQNKHDLMFLHSRIVSNRKSLIKSRAYLKAVGTERFWTWVRQLRGLFK